jgi:hypothetical protein
VKPRAWLTAAGALVLLAACAPTNTTIRFKSNREAVAVSNPEKPKGGDKLETLIGTRKKIFLFVPHGALVASFNSSVEPVVGEKKLVADFSIGEHSLRTFVIQLRRPLASAASPSPQNKDAICREPTIANILGGASTEIVGVGRGSWIATSSSSRHLYIRPIDSDLAVLVDADSLDSARATNFILRMGSLTFD